MAQPVLAGSRASGTVGLVPAVLAVLLGSPATASLPTGCILHGRTWYGSTECSPKPANISDAEACRAACGSVSGCRNFSFWPEQDDCILICDVAGELQDAENDVLTGPRVCEEAACYALPAATFPGSSEMADWPSLGYQPQSLQCWPGFCDKVEYVDNAPASQSWIMTCEIWEQTELHGGESCKERCHSEAGCSSFGISSHDDCFLSNGFDCHAASAALASNQLPEVPQTVLRGDVRVLRSLGGVRVPGLEMAFKVADYTGHTVQDASRMCAQVCYSILACQYWQFNTDPVYGGCWLQYEELSVRYPLHDGDLLLADPDWAFGEYIQHTCPPETVLGVEVPSWVHETWVQISAGVILCFCIFCAVGSVRQWCNDDAKRSRAVTSRTSEAQDSKAELAEESRPMHRLVAAERYAELSALPEMPGESPESSEEVPLIHAREYSAVPSAVSFASSSPLLLPVQAQLGQYTAVQQFPQMASAPSFPPMPVLQQHPAGYTAMPTFGYAALLPSPASSPGSSMRLVPGPSIYSTARAGPPAGAASTPAPPPRLPRSNESPHEWGTTLTISPGI